MTYLEERKKLLEDIHADGGVNYELEDEIKRLEDIHDTFDRFIKVLTKDCQWCGENECVCPECGNEQDKCEDSSEGHCEDCDPQNSMGFIYG